MHQDADPVEYSNVLSFGAPEKSGVPLITFSVDENGELIIRIEDAALDNPQDTATLAFFLTQSPDTIDQKLLVALQDKLIKKPQRLNGITKILTRLKQLIALQSIERPTMTGFDAFTG